MFHTDCLVRQNIHSAVEVANLQKSLKYLAPLHLQSEIIEILVLSRPRTEGENFGILLRSDLLVNKVKNNFSSRDTEGEEARPKDEYKTVKFNALLRLQKRHLMFLWMCKSLQGENQNIEMENNYLQSIK